MGVVEGGCVSGVLPAQKLFAVHYPGYPSSVARGVETLGGREALAKARESEGNFLELRFRPEDPCAHPTFGEASATSNLLLRISRAASGADGGAESGEERVEVRADVVGLVEHEYSFDGMADYQYVLGVHAARGSKKRRGERDGEEGVQDVDMMMIVPPLFSLKDMPDDVVLRPVEFTRLRTVAQQPSREPSVLVQQGVFGGKVLGLDFKSKEIPPEINWEERLEKGSDEHFCQSTLGRLFRERPIWSKPRLLEKLEEEGVVLNGSQVKRLFLRTAYCFGYGPYRMTWIRNGYDPRSDPESRKYQIMDYRVPLIVRKPNIDEYVRREKKESEPAWKDMCMFKVAPRKKFSFFQLCDLEDDFIQAEIKKPAERATCGASTGWFKRGTLEKIRLHVRLRFLRLIPGEVARAVEAAELKSLQRVRFQPAAPDDGTVLSTDRLRVPPRRRDVASHLPNASTFHPDLTLGGHPFYEDLRVKNGFLPSQKTRGQLNEASSLGDEAVHLEETEDNDEEDEDEDELNDEEEDEAVDEVDDHFEEEEEEEEEEMEEEEETMASRAASGFRDMGMEFMSNSYLQSLLEEFSEKGDAQQGTVGGEDVEEYAIFDQDDDDDVDDDY